MYGQTNKYLKKTMLIGTLVLTLGTFLFSGVCMGAKSKYAGTHITGTLTADPYGYAMREMAPDFEKETGIKVTIEVVPYQGYREKIAMDFVSGKGTYDFTIVDLPWYGEFCGGGEILGITDWVKKCKEELAWDDIIESGRQVSYWDNVLYGVPIIANPCLVMYRKDLLTEAGLPVPETFDQYLDTAKKLTRPEQDVYGAAECMRRGSPIVADWIFFFTGTGGRIFADPPTNYYPVFNGPMGVKITEFYKNLLQYMPPGAINYDWDERATAMQQGRVALMLSGDEYFNQMYDPEASVVGDKIAFTLPPHLPGQEAEAGIPYVFVPLGINADSKHPEATFEYFKWAVSKKVHREFLFKGGNAIRLSELGDPELQKRFPWFKTLAPLVKTGKDNAWYRPRIAEWPYIESVLGLHLNNVMVGKESVKEALDAAATEALKRLKKAGKPLEPVKPI